MEMTIEKHLTQLKKLKSFHNGSYGASINFAIETMHKYQKIQEIIKDWEDGRFSDVVGCLRVKAVLDGNDD